MNRADTARASILLPLIALYAALVLVALDGAIVNVALPTLAVSLHTTAAASVAVATSYQLAVVMVLLPFAALGESVGPRRVFVGGVVLFTTASALCALSTSLAMLVAARFAQGLGGGAIMALVAMLLRFAMPPDRLASAIGWNAVMVALSGAAGPSVGAAILSAASWPWLFAVNLPIGVLALWAARALPAVPGTGRRVDALSAATSAAAFAMFFAGANRLFETPALGAALLAAAALCIVYLVRRERGRAAPLAPVDLFISPLFARTVFASACTFAAQVLANVALPFLYQGALGADVVHVGLYMTVWPLGIVAVASFSGRLAARASASRLCAIGTGVLALGLVWAGLSPVSAGVAPILVGVALAGLGFGTFQPANNRMLLLSAPKARSGAAGGVQATTRLFGQTLGASVMAALFLAAPADAAARLGLFVAAGFSLAASLVGAYNARRQLQ
jgi:DHA2 family multidrug resistance protein-like MFS transporter